MDLNTAVVEPALIHYEHYFVSQLHVYDYSMRTMLALKHLSMASRISLYSKDVFLITTKAFR